MSNEQSPICTTKRTKTKKSITKNAPYWEDFKGTKPSESLLMDYGTASIKCIYLNKVL